MKAHYDFSQGVRGKFYRQNETHRLPDEAAEPTCVALLVTNNTDTAKPLTVTDIIGGLATELPAENA